MKIALLGYGKMGKLVETIALRERMQVGPKLDINDNPGGRGITSATMEGVDVAIEFSQPDAVIPNIEAAARAGVHVVVGTTGWADQRRKVEQIVLDSEIGLIYGSNFSLGMNLFFEIVSHSARLIGMLPQYDAYLSEEHHRAKKDAPSGTALSLLDLRIARRLPLRGVSAAEPSVDRQVQHKPVYPVKHREDDRLSR